MYIHTNNSLVDSALGMYISRVKPCFRQGEDVSGEGGEVELYRTIDLSSLCRVVSFDRPWGLGNETCACADLQLMSYLGADHMCDDD